jgi:hypothetical protein
LTLVSDLLSKYFNLLALTFEWYVLGLWYFTQVFLLTRPKRFDLVTLAFVFDLHFLVTRAFHGIWSFLAHLSWKLMWAFLIAHCPSVSLSVCLSVCKLLPFQLVFQNHWANFNKTCFLKSLLVYIVKKVAQECFSQVQACKVLA